MKQLIIILLGWLGFGRTLVACNEAGTHAGCVTRSLEEAVPEKYLLAKVGTVEETDVGICDEADEPLGVMTDEGGIGDHVNVELESSHSTWLCTASGAITAGATVYGADGGLVTTTAPSTGWGIGRALTTAADGELVEVQPRIRPKTA